MLYRENEKNPEEIGKINAGFATWVNSFPKSWLADAEEHLSANRGFFDQISRDVSAEFARISLVADHLEYTGDLRDAGNDHYARLLYLVERGINNPAEAHKGGITTEVLIKCILFLRERTVREGKEQIKLTGLFLKICQLHDKKTVFDLISQNQDFLLFISGPFNSCSDSLFFDVEDESLKFRNKVEEALYIKNIFFGMGRTLNFQYATQLAFVEDMEKPFNFSELSQLLWDQEKKAYELMKNCLPNILYANLLREIERALDRKKAGMIGQACSFPIGLDFVAKVMSLLLEGIDQHTENRKGCQKLFFLICERFDQNSVITMIQDNPQFLKFICASELFSIGKPAFQSCIEKNLGIEIKRSVFGEEYQIKILNLNAPPEPDIFNVVASQASLLGASMMRGISDAVPRRAPATVPQYNKKQDVELSSLNLVSSDEESSSSLISS